MNPNEKQIPVDYNKPVAYDANGKPLYAHPPIASTHVDKPNNNVVHDSEPGAQIVTDSAKPKPKKSGNDYGLNLSAGEHVILSVKRHPIGLLTPIFLGFLLFILSLTLLVNINAVVESIQVTGVEVDSISIALPIVLFMALIVFGTYVAYHVFTSNKLFITNESVIQIIQNSIFSKREQIVSLSDVENVSYTQNGIVQQMLGFGSIKLSGEGVGQVYNFTFVADPKKVMSVLNDAVEVAKKTKKDN